MATTTSSNYTSLYGADGSTIVPTTPYGNANVVSLLATSTDGANTIGNISATGNIAGNVFIGNGAGLTNIAGGNIVGGYGNANVVSLLSAFGSNSVSTTGNVTAGNIIGNGSGLSSITGANVTGTVANATFATSAGTATSANTAATVTSNAQANITSVGVLTSLSVSGNTQSGNVFTPGTVSATGNVTGNYFLGNGSQLTGLPATYSNANVTSLLAAFGSNTISTTGNITSGNLKTPGLVSATGNISTQGYFIGTFLGNIVGNLIVPGANTQVLYNNNGNADASAGFTFDSASNAVVVIGNITGANINGNGSGLSSITGANVTGTVANATYAVSAGSATTAATVTGNAQANITSVGVLTALSVTGNTQSGNLLTSGTVSAGGNITGGTLSIGTGNTGDAIIYGNLTVYGNTTTINSNTITTNDLNITVGNNQNTGAALNNAGVDVGNNNLATWRFNNATTSWQSNIAVTPTANATLDMGGASNYWGTGYFNAANIATTVSATGNITGNYFVGNGSQLTGVVATGIGTLASLSVTGNTDTGNLRTAGQVSAAGNVTGSNFIGNGSALTAITGANVTGTVANATFATSAGTANTAATVTSNAQANITSVGILTSLSVSGNVTANYFLGNGSQLTGLPAGYSNADVTTLLAAFGSNTISTTGNITSGNSTVTTTLYASNITGAAGQNVTVTADGTGDIHLDADSVRVGDNNSPATIVTHGTGNLILRTHEGDASQGNITLVNGANSNIQLNPNGTGVVTTTGISATGNVTANYFLGNGSQLTGLPVQPGTYGNANVVANLAALGSNPVSTSGNVTAGYFVGNGSLLSNITAANVTGNVATANAALFLKSSTNAGLNMSIDSANLKVDLPGGGILSFSGFDANTYGSIDFGPPQANIADSYVGFSHFTQANILATPVNTVSVGINGPAMIYDVYNTGKSLFLGSGGLTTNAPLSAAGNITTAANFVGNGAALTGIVKGSNTQLQFNNAGAFAGNAAMAFDNTTGNVTLSTLIVGNNTGNNSLGATKLNTTATFVGQPSSSANIIPGQILIGNGYFGSFNASSAGTPAGATKGAKFIIWDSVNLASANRYSAFQTMAQVVVAANSSPQIRGAVTHLQFGGGANANTSGTGAAGVPAYNQQLVVGGGTQLPLIGNIVATGGSGILSGIQVNAGSTLLTGVTVGTSFSCDATAVLGNAVSFAASVTTAATPTAVYGYYMGDNTNPWGYNQSNTARSASSYYFLYNADSVAQSQLGSLRAYHTFQASGNTTGTWNIDKSAGQVQVISATGNVTIGTYTNFVTTANDSVNNDKQTDTVTLIIEQGATPYTVTMPTGNAAIRYANGVSNVTATANSTTMIAITAFRTAANAASYLTTISPSFT